MSIDKILIKLRKEKNLSQEEVADKLNVTRQTVSKWETGQSTPDFDKIKPICELFEISADELLNGNVKEKKLKLENNSKNIKKTKMLVVGIFLYFVSAFWIMIAIPVLNINPVVSSAIFILICGLATSIIVYSKIAYKNYNLKENKEENKDNKLYKQIDKIISIITVIIYLIISFATMAWHITWIIFLIYALIMQIVKLILSLRGTNEK